VEIGVDEDPALCHTAVSREHLVMAIALAEWGYGLGLGLGHGSLGFAESGRHPGDPLACYLGQRGKVLGAIEGTVGHQVGAP
jgi:hypothetical protein